MINNLNGKVIIITGGNGLLGKSIIKDVNKAGGVAINLDINHKTNIFKRRINCDISNVNSIDSAINIILQEFGQIDGWVNNAYPRTSDWNTKFENIKIDSWKINVDLQLNTIFICCQKVLKIMKKQKFGNIVNIASIYGIVGPDFNLYQNIEITMPAAYSAIKGGVINFSKYLASYYGKNNIRVNCVSPGGIFNHQNKNFIKRYESKVPLKKMAKPDQISPAIIFLLSDSASYITGHNLIVDGGWTII